MQSDISFLEDLSQEHQAFLEFLDAWEKNPRIISRESFESFATLLEEVHHKKEEELLFPLLEGAEALNVGGPKCITFFTPRVLGGYTWKDSFHDLVDSIPPTAQKLSAFRQRIFQANSMMKIPVEDHILGSRAVEELRSLWAKGNASHEAFSSLFSKFASLLRDHIQREEECLFELCKRILSPEQKRHNVEQSQLFNEKLGRVKLLSDLRFILKNKP